MVIDLTKCMRCYACVVACEMEHFLPPDVHWSRLAIWETGEYPAVTEVVYPLSCMHCQNAPCVKACPTGASQQREDGIVWIDQSKCVGCRYCTIACPYQSRTFLSEIKEFFPGYGLTEYEKIGRRLYPHSAGAIEKCNFCMERIDAGLAKGLKPGIDREATPVCVNACPSKALHFGDLDDPNSDVATLIRKKKGAQLHPEFGTDPSTYYIIG